MMSPGGPFPLMVMGYCFAGFGMALQVHWMKSRFTTRANNQIHRMLRAMGWSVASMTHPRNWDFYTQDMVCHISTVLRDAAQLYVWSLRTWRVRCTTHCHTIFKNGGKLALLLHYLDGFICFKRDISVLCIWDKASRGWISTQADFITNDPWQKDQKSWQIQDSPSGRRTLWETTCSNKFSGFLHYTASLSLLSFMWESKLPSVAGSLPSLRQNAQQDQMLGISLRDFLAGSWLGE